MELALSLGDTSKPFQLLDKTQKSSSFNKDVGFNMALGLNSGEGEEEFRRRDHHEDEIKASSDPPPLQLDLLPFSPVQRRQQLSSHIRLPWLNDNLMSEAGSSNGRCQIGGVNRLQTTSLAVEEAEEGATLSSPNSTVSSFQNNMDFSFYTRSPSGRSNQRSSDNYNAEPTNELDETNNGGLVGCFSRGCSDDDENGLTRKKLRLSKEQSAFLEESFKEHNTLTPKQKLALSKQLNLRPRQVEVWFQNRRARTKLKQTEVDCEYLKRCCETLTEENRRLRKELQELRALKTSQPFFMQLPATTLTMCPSCERVASTTSSASPTCNATSPVASATVGNTSSTATLALGKSRVYPFNTQVLPQGNQAAS